jgi:hypothetical protein
MSSGSPTLPPSALSNAQARARIDQIAVRIINLPDGLRSNASPVKISGTVSGQNPDGSMTVRTDKGDISILLRDKGALPTGTKIDIDIPAGRNPQQASIKSSDQQSGTPVSDKPNLAQSLYSTLESSPLEIKAKLNTETLGSVITSAQIPIDGDAPIAIPIAGGALQAGQLIRLLPVPPHSLPADILNTLLTPQSTPDLIAGLVSIIENFPKEAIAQRAALITVLSRLDLSTLTQSDNHQSATTPTTSTAPSQLLAKIENLLQSIGLTGNFKNETGAPQTLTPQSPALSSQNFSVFNPSKPLDGQVIAFQPVQPPAQLSATPPPLSVLSTPLKPEILQNVPISAGQVIGFTAQNLPLLSIPLPHTGLTQIYTLQFGANNVAAGSPVFIALDPLSTRPTQTLFIQAADGNISLTSPSLATGLPDWDSFDSLFKTLIHLAPTEAQNFAQTIPSPAHPQTMGALSLFFLSVLRSGGQIENMMTTETVALLKQMGKIDSLRAANADMGIASRLDNLTLPQDWRMALLPLMWENQIYKAPLYYKHYPEEGGKDDNDAKKRRKLRFLFDLKLSRMGGVQVDGFMQSERLDIILRTKSPLSPPMQSQMKRIYAGAMDKSRLTGDLSFQFKPEHWVDFSEPFEKTTLNA